MGVERAELESSQLMRPRWRSWIFATKIRKREV